MIELDDGNISVLGQPIKTFSHRKFGLRIGYMPQEIALIEELTVKETIRYFGRIFQMSSEKLRARYELLTDLLEIADGDQRIMDCSGGEKRRVSFACAIIHEPDLLILDEPTVGLDPLLREKIWNFMTQFTQNKNSSILVTTHYIHEAEQADRCGLMRNGILLAEDSPSSIIQRFEVEDLDEAFLKLCLSQHALQDSATAINKDSDEEINEVDSKIQSIEQTDNLPSDDNNTEHLDRKPFSFLTIQALFMKAVHILTRQPT